MKKITLALALLTFGMQAQTFPSPYCDMTDAADVSVEAISTVNFAGATITNSDGTTVLINETATIANVTAGETYALVVEGNTEGAFDNNIVAFIDWNNNNTLDDAGEIYQVGTLTNSNGTDGVSVTLDITVPADAVIGLTRIRITKTYTDEDSPAEIDACGILFDAFGQGIYAGFGQALDFTLDIEAMPAPNFPEPYCDIADAAQVDVEEITLVSFAGTAITNTDINSVLIDETATVVNIAAGETYALVVEGNTAGAFDTNIVAFIDWNQNNTLDDAGEIYEVGILSDSDGTDGVSVTLDINVPTDAVLGTTRIRITKTYTDEDSPADINACGITFDAFGQGSFPAFGQALDFTLNIAALSVDTFDLRALSVYPVPTQDVLHINYKSAISSVKIYNLLGQEVLAKSSNSNTLEVDVSALTSGAYMVKLVSDGSEHIMRILKK